ncbi:SDR family NAD(P)-dependent oxidoreductase [Variovorax sp.]|jgi:3-oxoacyl-[acyl-carrier protein] reductase|uniref:SDR family NAD(P)-dependent oxidoreductase n=1 Tax=Variovorax sp. TaxID=1871043 RepID=UPI003BA8DEB7
MKQQSYQAANFSVDDKVVLITGAGSGIGRAMAIGLADAGARIAVIDRDFESAHQVANEIGMQRAVAVECDVTDEEAVARTVETTLDQWGRIDGLINNAGQLHRCLVKDHTLADWQRIFEVNVMGTFLFARAVLPQMIRQRNGRIVNFTSALGVRSMPGGAAYGATKAAVTSFTNTLHQEVCGEGISVTAIAPGLTNTPMANDHMTSEYMERIAASYPGGRLGQPEDIIGLAHFLMTDASRHVSGTTLFVRPPGG